MRVRNAHTSAVDGHKPGALFDVDPDHAAWKPLLAAGVLVPASASDVRFGPDDPPPSTEAVRELVAGINARNREIDALHESVESLASEHAAERAKSAALQARVNELEALLALRQGATPDEAPIRAAVQAAEAALTARFDAAYEELAAGRDALATENARLKTDLDALLAAPAKPAVEAVEAVVDTATPKPAKPPKA